MSDMFYSWDDRKRLLDVYYAGGGRVGEELSLREDIYEGLMAVANYALAEERYLEGTGPEPSYESAESKSAPNWETEETRISK